MPEFTSTRLTWGDVDTLLHGEEGQSARQALYSQGIRGGEAAMAASHLERLLGDEKQVRFEGTKRIEYDPKRHVLNEVEGLCRRFSAALVANTPAPIQAGQATTISSIFQRLGIASLVKNPAKA